MPDSSDKHLPTVAVVIPAYNIDPYVARAIESALTQTHKADQIIVVDDGSTDATAERIKQFGSQVQYIHQPNAGLSAARNTGIKAADTEWIAFLDGDDFWLPEKLQLQLNLAQRNSHLVWVGASCYVCQGLDGRRVRQRHTDDIDKKLAGQEFFPDYFAAAVGGSVGNPDTMIIKKHVFQELGLFQEGLAYMEDQDMWWRIAYRWPQIGYINQPLAVYYRMRPGSLSTETAREEKTRHLCYLLDTHLTLAAENNRLAEFKILAAGMLLWWMKNLYQEKSFAQIRDILKRYGHLLPFWYKKNMRLKATFPRLYSKIARYTRTTLNYTLGICT